MASGANPPAKRVNLYFVASPLQYLVSRRLVEQGEQDACNILVYYKPGAASVVRREHWDAVSYMPWPRFEPLPGPAGRLKRLRANLSLVDALLPPCHELRMHTAVIDTEAINYFVNHFAKRMAGGQFSVRLLPDGVIGLRRYPLSLPKRLWQRTRKLRRLIAPELDYYCFAGDRIGSDAPIVDRIYVLKGFPHEYDPRKVHVLPPLVTPARCDDQLNAGKRALVIGQPLEGAGLLSREARERVTDEIRDWLLAAGCSEIHYKAHPKDPRRELYHADYQEISTDEPLESYLAKHPYAVIAGVRSTSLVMARQICGEQTQVLAFGLEQVKFKSPSERQTMLELFKTCGIERL